MDCYQLVQQTTGYSDAFQEDWLRPVNSEAILTRMLNNLRLLYLQSQDWPHAQAVVEHLRQLRPEIPELLRDLGVIHHREGSLKRAVGYYEQYLLRAPQAPDTVDVRSYLQSAVRQLAQLN
jgi:regulator of sirC expression with transglutaminase-like and TPR domain